KHILAFPRFMFGVGQERLQGDVLFSQETVRLTVHANGADQGMRSPRPVRRRLFIKLVGRGPDAGVWIDGCQWISRSAKLRRDRFLKRSLPVASKQGKPRQK